MTSKKFIAAFIAATALQIAAFAGLNWVANDFGLFGDRKSIRIWAREKSSKYLLSFHYIPNHFDGFLIGPSVSANMDFAPVAEHKIYNLSMNSGNITELKYAADNVLNSGKARFIVICLYPYMTKNHGCKDFQIDPKVYWGSLLSDLPLAIWAAKFRHWLHPEIERKFSRSENGYHNFNLEKKGVDFSKIAARRGKSPQSITVDPIAYEELKSVISLAHHQNVEVFAYYFPIYHAFQQRYVAGGAWGEYQAQMNDLFSAEDVVWDMNQPEYWYITKDMASYSDGHLSDQGAAKVVEVIREKLNQSLSNAEAASGAILPDSGLDRKK